MAIDNQDVRWFSALGVLVLVALAYIMLPRYEWRTVNDTTSVTIIVYDRWTGRMQRAVYGNNGSLNVMGVYTPF